MAENPPFLRTSGRFTANFASFPSYFRQVHRYFLVVARPPRSRGDLSNWNQTWARNGCHLNPKKGPLVQLLHTPAIVATLLAWTSSPAKSPPRIATLWLQGDWRASLGLAHGRDLGGRPGPSAAPRHSGWRGFVRAFVSGERNEHVGPPLVASQGSPACEPCLVSL